VKKTDWMPDDERFRLGCPMLYRAIKGRKFLVPNYRQAHYENQDTLNNDFEFGLLSVTSGERGYTDDVNNAQYANMCGALGCGRPMLFLEKELGEKLVQAPLPKGMVTTDIRWPWRQLRVILPLGLLTIEREGVQYSMTYLDMVQVPPEGMTLPKRFVTELEAFAEKYMPTEFYSGRRVPTDKLLVIMKDLYISVVGAINWSEVGFGPTTYGYTAPWTDQKLDELVGYSGGLNTAMACDDKDRVLIDKMKHLAITVLLWLSQKPIRYLPEVVRKEQMEGKRLKPELARAHFVGQEAFKAVLIRHKGPHELTGRHLPAHLRKGHWKMQPYGPKSSLRRWQWVDMYMTEERK
jgi:hypothetical protein